MNKRAKICLYIFVIVSFLALGILGYFVFNNGGQNVMLGSRKFVTFNRVKNATSYSVEVNNQDRTQTANAVYFVDKQPIEDQKQTYNYNITVKKDEKIIAKENYTQEITNQNAETNTIDCKIKDYTIDFFDENENSTGETVKIIDQTLKNVDEETFCFVVSDYFDNLFNKDGTFYVKCTPYNDGEELLGDDGEDLSIEKKYEYKAFYKADFLRRENFFYNGIWYDYVIENEDELNNFVWWTILYRKGESEITFYVDSPEIKQSNINYLINKAIGDYPEYIGFNELKINIKMDNNIVTLSNFDYYLDENFTLTYKDLNDVNSSNYEKALNYKAKKFDEFDVEYVSKQVDDEREFKIDSSIDEVIVYNTEQLMMVVQSGAKPKFVEGQSDVAKVVYDNAKNVLRQINNSNSLSDYEKSLNIYKYITSQIMYDWVTYQFMYYQKDFSIKSFGNYSCFYLEGVFYNFDGLDGHYAVCDGLSKAYSLLCNIEGIKCFKVNGEVINQGNHAWNKIYLEKEDNYNLEQGWYFVDTTWGEGQISDSNAQYLTHNYFLFKQNDLERIILYPENTENENPSKKYDYYKNTRYSVIISEEVVTADCYVETDNEFEKILQIAFAKYSANRKPYAVEIKLDRDYLDTNNNLYLEFISIKSNFERLSFASRHSIGANWSWIRSDDIFIIYFS